jgi:hypothetical protein
MRLALVKFLFAPLAASAVAVSGCAPMQSATSGSVVPTAHALTPLSGGTGGGGGGTAGGGSGGGGGAVNVTLTGSIVPDLTAPNIRGSLVYTQAGGFEKLTGDLVDTGVVQPQQPAIQITVGLFIKGTLVNWASIVPTNGIPLEFTAICPDITPASTDCAGFVGEFAHAPGGGVPSQTVPVLTAGALVDVQLFKGVIGRSIFDANGRTSVQHIGTATLR